MRKRLLVFAVILGLISACSNDDDPASQQLDPIQQPKPEPEPELVNKPPGAFGLISPQADNDREVLLPTFVWESATDSDGDAVTYDLYVGSETDPQMKMATSIADTTFTPTVNLELFANYFWKVVAKDSKGADNPSTIQKFEVKPRLFATEFEFAGRFTQFTYKEHGMIKEINDVYSNTVVISYSPEGKLSKQISNFEIIDYEYDNDGRLIMIKNLPKPNLNEATIKMFEYNKFGQIKRIEIFIENGTDIVRELSFFYRDGESMPLGISYVVSKDNGNQNYDIFSVKHYNFTWDENENLIEILTETDYQMGNGFVFSGIHSISYDTLQNPAYDIVKKSFGWNHFFIKSEDNYLLKTTYLIDDLGWVSKNNVLAYKYINSDLDESNLQYNYEYNAEGYAKSVILKATFRNNPPKFKEGSWKYD